MKTVKPNSKSKQLRLDRDGRDEMNLIEFPFALLSERGNGRSVLEFERESYDRVLGKPVLRKLTVTGDPKYGLPTSKDEEVYLGLLQLTKVTNDFNDPRVCFTRSQLIKLMGWKNRDWAYHRIRRALYRLTGVRLFYENAWRDNARKQFCDQGGFGLLDSFVIRDGRFRAKDGDGTERLSEFRWNSVVFGSFEAGYVKKLDYPMVCTLSAVARRVYRYLDKHFHPPFRMTIKMDLKTFAFEHIGFSRNNDNAQLKRALAKPLRELEVIGFLRPCKRRFRKTEGIRGAWQVEFTMVPSKSTNSFRDATGKTSRSVERVVSRRRGKDRIDQYIDSLKPAELISLERKAMVGATGFYRDLSEAQKDGPMADACRRQIVRAYLAKKRTD